MMADRSIGLWFSVVPVLAGFAVLVLAGVALPLYLVQVGSLLLAAVLVWLGARSKGDVLPGTLQALACLLVLLLGVPLLTVVPADAPAQPYVGCSLVRCSFIVAVYWCRPFWY